MQTRASFRTSTLNRMEDLTHRHLRGVTQAYQYASICAHAMKHLRDLRSMYDNALSAKHAYHTILPTHIQDQMHITRTHHMWQQHISKTTKAYHATKRRPYTFYFKSGTILELYEQFTRHLHRLQALTNAHCSYTPHILCDVLDWARRQRLETSTLQTMHQLYTAEQRHIQKQRYLHRKRPREVWDPTLWEIPLLPLPK